MPEYLDPVLGVAYIVSDVSALRYMEEYADRVLIVVQHPYPQKLYVFDAESLASDDGSTSLKPHNISVSDPGRWLLEGIGGGGAGTFTFLLLSDTPGSYAGAGGQLVRVKATQDGLEFAPSSSCVECPYEDNPDNWVGMQIPDTVLEAIQACVRILCNHTNTLITASASGGEGCPYVDDSRYWTGGIVPDNITDALRDFAAFLSFHMGAPIPNVGISQGCVSFSDSPGNWATGVAPDTVLEATQCVVAALVGHISYDLFDFGRFSGAECAYDEPNVFNWLDGNFPPTVEQALQAAIDAFVDHQGQLTATVTGYAGCPYNAEATHWVGSPPTTLADAVLSFIDNLDAHIGPPHLTNVGSKQGTVPYLGDDPAHWDGQMPFTILEAVQSGIEELVAHLAYPIRRLPEGCEKECDYTDNPLIWENNQPPTSITQAINMLAYEYKLHTGVAVPCSLVGIEGCKYTKTADWATLPSASPGTIDVAIRLLAYAFYTHPGIALVKSGSWGCAIWKGEGSYWVSGVSPLTQLEAVTSLAAVWSTHIGRPLTNTEVKTFLRLEDTPSTYLTHANKMVTVNPGETGLEFTTIEYGTNMAPTFVVASEDALDTARDASDPTFLHKNGVNDGVLNAVNAMETAGNGGMLHIRRGTYQTAANKAFTAPVEIRGEGPGATVLSLIDDAPATAHWLFQFNSASQLRNLGIHAEVLTGLRPDSIVTTNSAPCIVDNVAFVASSPAGVNLGFLTILENTHVKDCLFYGTNDYSTSVFAEAAPLKLEHCQGLVGGLSKVVYLGGNCSYSKIINNNLAHLTGGTTIYFDPGSVDVENVDITNNTLLGSIVGTGDGTGVNYINTYIQGNQIQYASLPGIYFLPDTGGVFYNGKILGNEVIFVPGGAALQGIMIGPDTIAGTNIGCRKTLISGNNIDIINRANGIGIQVGGYGSYANRIVNNEISGAGGLNQGGIYLYRNSTFSTLVQGNTIQIGLGVTNVGMSTAQGGINCLLCSDMVIENNGIVIGDSEFGRGIRIAGDDSYTGFNVNGNNIRFLGSATPITSKMEGISVGPLISGNGPSIITLDGNTLIMIDNSTGIEASAANIAGTATGNVVAFASTHYNLSGNIDGVNNKSIV